MPISFDFNEQEITKNYLLSKHSEEVYMEHYLGIPVKKGLFRSPLRKDSNPTCSFYRNSKGELIFKDFSGDFYGNFINVVMRMFNLSYYSAMNKIAADFNLTNDTVSAVKQEIVEPPKFESSGPSKIQVETQPFTAAELNWWKDFGITPEILKKYKVFSCEHIFLNDSIIGESSSKCPIYGYYGNKMNKLELWRIYYPFNRKRGIRFLTNWPAKKIQGFEQLPDTGNLLVITKSMKDVMCLSSLGINAIAPNSENLFISDSVLEQLKQRFKIIIVLYDNDLAGLDNMREIKEKHPDLIYSWIPRKYNAKDISDFYKKYGKDKTVEFLKEYIIWLKNR